MPAQWFFAWVDPADTTFSASHMVLDEDVYSIQLDGKEGECVILTAVLLNPRIGLLNAGRKVWVWLSWSDGVNVYPQFFGQLVGIPGNVFSNTLTLIFVGKPLDFDQQRFDVSQALKELPWFDPIFIDSRLWDDPDAIVETRSVRWQVSRGDDGAPLAVSVSDVLEGEDGVEVFEESEVPVGSISFNFSGAPLRSISVKASVTWDQTGQADLALPIKLPAQIVGFNESLYTDWPKPGASLGGGWAAGPDSFALDLFGAHNLHTGSTDFTFHNTAKQHSTGDVMSSSHHTTFAIGPVGFSQVLTEHVIQGLIWPGGGYGTITTNWTTVADGNDNNDDPDINIPYHYDRSSLEVALFTIAPRLSVTAEGGVIKRKESVTFTLEADVQAIMTAPAPAPSSPPNPIEQPGADVGIPIVGEGGTVAEPLPPIGDATLSHYFPTARGILSLENRLLWARAQLRWGDRVGQSSWQIPFERALFMSCRKSAQLNWRNMPGGSVRGKVVAWQLFHNVQTGKRYGTVSIGATPGHDGAASAVSGGGNDYVESDYIDDGHFVNSADIVVSDASLSDFGYSVPVADTYDGGFPLKYEDVVLGVSVTGSLAGQLQALSGNAPKFYTPTALSPDQQADAIRDAEIALQNWLEDQTTQVHVQLAPIDGNGFEIEYPITTTLLSLPKTIDCEAPSNA